MGLKTVEQMYASKLQIELHVEGNGSGLLQGNISVFTWRDCVRPQTFGIASEIQVSHVQDGGHTTWSNKRRQEATENLFWRLTARTTTLVKSVLCIEGLCELESAVVCSATWRAECLLSLTAGHFTASLQDPKPCKPRASPSVAASWSRWEVKRVRFWRWRQ